MCCAKSGFCSRKTVRPPAFTWHHSSESKPAPHTSTLAGALNDWMACTTVLAWHGWGEASMRHGEEERNRPGQTGQHAAERMRRPVSGLPTSCGASCICGWKYFL